MIDTEEKAVCPRCGEEYLKYLASLCRRDNKTLICSACGDAEAFEDYLNEPYRGVPYWEIPK